MPPKRTKPPPHTTRDYLATLEHAIRQLSYSQHLFTTFRHFVELSAIAFSNVADPSNKDARESAVPRDHEAVQARNVPDVPGTPRYARGVLRAGAHRCARR